MLPTTPSDLVALLHALTAKLDTLTSEVAAVRAQQNVDNEFQLELVKFLELTRNEQRTRDEAILAAIKGKAGGAGAQDTTRGLAEVVARYFEQLQKCGERQTGDLLRQIDLVKQVANAAVRKLPPSGQRIRCVFLVHVFEAWDALSDVHQAMLADARFEPLVATIPRRFPGDKGYGGEEATSKALSDIGVRHLRLGMSNSMEALDVLKALGPDVIFRQSHWENDVPPGFRTPELVFARLCSVPYGTSLVQRFMVNERVDGDVSAFAFDQAYHRVAWRIFCETEATRSYFQGFRHSDPEKFVLSGFPKLESLQRAGRRAVWPLSGGERRGYRVIWAPHHSVGDKWLAFGVFHLIYRQMLEWARSAPDIEFVLKPHPALMKSLVLERRLKEETLDAFVREWESLENCCVRTGQYAELFAASDLMITDGLSFLTEYQLFRKPLIFIDSGRHVPFNTIGALAEACSHRVRSFEEMKQAALGYKAGAAWPFEAEREKLLKVLLPNRQPAASVILDSIHDGIRSASRL